MYYLQICDARNSIERNSQTSHCLILNCADKIYLLTKKSRLSMEVLQNLSI